MGEWSPSTCLVIGASGGIGKAFVELLLDHDGVETVFAFSRSRSLSLESEKLVRGHLDFDAPPSIEAAAQMVARHGPVDLVIVATGLLHDESGLQPEKSLRDLDARRLAQSYATNAIGPILLAKAFLPLLRRDEKSVFAALSARVGSISDNRIGGWYGYRAAKAGLNQLIRTASIEHARRWPQSVIIGLHPGTVNTHLSKPFQKNVPRGGLFSPSQAARQMMSVIDQTSAEDSGKVLTYDGSQVPA